MQTDKKMAEDERALVQRLFDTHMEYQRAEEAVVDLVNQCVGGWEDMSHDWYDRSLEIFGPSVTASDLPRLARAGLDRIWLHGAKCAMPRGGDKCQCPSTDLRPLREE